jgi:hypothetical protein
LEITIGTVVAVPSVPHLAVADRLMVFASRSRRRPLLTFFVTVMVVSPVPHAGALIVWPEVDF